MYSRLRAFAWHQSLKRECIRPLCPLSLKEAQTIVEKFVEHYNTRRLHSAIGYVSPYDKLYNREKEIFAERDRNGVTPSDCAV
jgi:transposase InsO family protein